MGQTDKRTISTENIKLVFVILKIHFFKKDSVRFLGCFKNHFQQ